MGRNRSKILDPQGQGGIRNEVHPREKFFMYFVVSGRGPFLPYRVNPVN